MVFQVIAGDDDTEVSLRESNATFKFNFKDVYWNSRLQGEHNRMIDLIYNSTDNGHIISTKKINGDPLSSKKINGDPLSSSKIDGAPLSSSKIDGAPLSSSKIDGTPLSSITTNGSPISMNKINGVVVADMMAGIGPFAVPLAMNGIKVYANGKFTPPLLYACRLLYVCIIIFLPPLLFTCMSGMPPN
jgi:Met-10+ like-protein